MTLVFDRVSKKGGTVFLCNKAESGRNPGVSELSWHCIILRNCVQLG